WLDLVEFHRTGNVFKAESDLELSKYSERGNQLHNKLAFGTIENPLTAFYDSSGRGLQFSNYDMLRKYQEQRLGDSCGGKVTEYSLCGTIDSLEVRGTMDAFDLSTGTILEIKTRSKATFPYFSEKKHKFQVLVYYFLVKNYDTTKNFDGFPADYLSDYVKVQYYSQDNDGFMGELVIHIPYEMPRFKHILKSFADFWLGTRPPFYSLKQCKFCRYAASACYFYKRFYRHDFKRKAAPDDGAEDEQS
nr:PD-(D/E)XK nuclease family protein [Candidatus Sigynarchaeota archaeon]